MPPVDATGQFQGRRLVDHKLEEARLLLDEALRLADGRNLNEPLAILGNKSSEGLGRGHEEMLAGANPWMGALL
ncbi:MAG: hypothetical protein WBM08_04040 [Prochlorococcaceae cyanobacterium]